jgi:hypothetical protein
MKPRSVGNGGRMPPSWPGPTLHTGLLHDDAAHAVPHQHGRRTEPTPHGLNIRDVIGDSE